MTTASRTMSFDDWMDHKGSTGSGDYLKNWKEDGSIDVVLHPVALPAVIWSHSWYDTFEDKDSKETKLRYVRFNSMESERILTKQRFRKPDGSREYPPEVCPFSLLLEWVRNAIEEGQISWVDPIFDIDAGEGVIIHAGGFCNLFGRDDLSSEELAELRKAGIRRDEAYTENGAARMQYLIPVIAYDEPALGCVVARESQTVGDKLKKIIRDRREDLGADAGDPRKNPIVFRWTFDDKLQFAAKYDVKAITSLPIYPEKLPDNAPAAQIEKLTALKQALEDDGAVASATIAKQTEPSNLVLLRRSFEKFWVHKVTPPWTELFAKAMARAAGTPAAQAPEDFDPDQLGDGDNSPDEASAPAASSDDDVACDKCGKPMKETADVCPHCGQKYVMDANLGYMVPAPDAPPPAPEKPKSRSEAAAARAPKRQQERSKS